MAFSPLSFALGVGIAYLTPIVSRGVRPLLVEAAALGIGFVEDARRIAAEQLENLEDIAAEARARREEIAAARAAHGDAGEVRDDAEAVIGDEVDGDEADDAEAEAEEPHVVDVPMNGARTRRRPSSRARSQGD